jgi:hypothetical protein
MHWGVFAISAARLLLYKITLKSPNPCETSERMNFNVIDKNIYSRSMVHVFRVRVVNTTFNNISVGQYNIRVTGPNGIMVAHKFCDIFFMKKRHQISIYKQFSG